MYSQRRLAEILRMGRLNQPKLEQVVICGRTTCERSFCPFDREMIKGEDKKWLLIDGCFICVNPDDQTMQSNWVQRGVKVLMGFQTYFIICMVYIVSILLSYSGDIYNLFICNQVGKNNTCLFQIIWNKQENWHFWQKSVFKIQESWSKILLY